MQTQTALVLLAILVLVVTWVHGYKAGNAKGTAWINKNNKELSLAIIVLLLQLFPPTSEDYYEQNRPKLKPTLVIDSHGSEFTYHFVLRNTGVLKAEELDCIQSGRGGMVNINNLPARGFFELAAGDEMS